MSLRLLTRHCFPLARGGVPPLGLTPSIGTTLTSVRIPLSNNSYLSECLKGPRSTITATAANSCLATRDFATSSSSDGTKETDEPPGPRRRRRRHNFDLTEVPTFEAFQQQQHIRSLYRQFLRLAYGSSSRDELLHQVRREFRQVISGDDPWALKRAISEGGRRYKELSAMLGSVPGGKKQQQEGSTDDESDDSRESSAWPWQGGRKTTGKPLAFPKR